MGKYYMGIDAGTASVRAAIYDDAGKSLANCVAEYSTVYPKSGWAEQDDKEWDAALQIAIPGAIEKAGIAPEEVVAVACDGTTSTVVFMDENFESVRKPILWMDVRAAKQAEKIFKSTHESSRFYPSGVPAESMFTKSMWVKENQPEIWEKTRYVMEYTDWINMQLTGKRVANKSAATVRGLYDDVNGGWVDSFLEEMGVADLKEKLPPEVKSFAEPVGNVTEEAAGKYGLAAGTLVAEGGIDALCCMVGMGVVDAGEMGLIGGTSNVLFGLSEVEFHAQGINGAYPNALVEGTSLVEGGQASAGSVLEWFVKNLIPAEWKEDAKAKDINIYDYVTMKASEIPIGCDGLYCLEYFQGNRVPYADSSARGVFAGLSLSHTTAHMARAVLEGVAFGNAHCLRAMADYGYKVEKVIACGGVATSDFWMQIFADSSGVEYCVVEDSQAAGCLCDAIAGTVASGRYGSLREAANAMVRYGKTYKPIPENVEEYKFYLERYMETWPEIRETIHKIVDHVS